MFYTINPPIDAHEHKVFIMGSTDELKFAEDICDTDLHRHCTGIQRYTQIELLYR